MSAEIPASEVSGERTCAVCGSPLLALDRFCPNCGAQVRPGRPAGRRPPRRRSPNWLFMLLVIVAIAGLAGVVVLVTRGSKKDQSAASTSTASTTSTSAAPTTTTTLPSRPYNVTGNLDGLIMRASPSRSSARVGQVPKGDRVLVHCVQTGDVVKDSSGPSSDRWDRITYGNTDGFVSDLYLTTGNDDLNPAIIPPCPFIPPVVPTTRR